MIRAIIDTEGDGLLTTLTRMWCAVALNIDTMEWHRFDFGNGRNSYEQFIEYLEQVEVFIGHNIIGYDIDAIRITTGYEYRGKLCDTLVMSRVLDPDRKLPLGCPTHIHDPSLGKQKSVGPHSLEAWGYRVAQAKPYIERWDVWDERIPLRCVEDVGINHKTLLSLLTEAEISEIPTVRL